MHSRSGSRERFQRKLCGRGKPLEHGWGPWLNEAILIPPSVLGKKGCARRLLQCFFICMSFHFGVAFLGDFFLCANFSLRRDETVGPLICWTQLALGGSFDRRFYVSLE